MSSSIKTTGGCYVPLGRFNRISLGWWGWGWSGMVVLVLVLVRRMVGVVVDVSDMSTERGAMAKGLRTAFTSAVMRAHMVMHGLNMRLEMTPALETGTAKVTLEWTQRLGPVGSLF